MEVSMQAALRDPDPIMDINTTPLVDVMLVLLIMFIITIPVQSHAIKLDLPSGPPPTIEVDPVVNRVIIDRTGALFWNGQAVSDSDFGALVAAAVKMPQEPDLQLQPDAFARYERVD